MLQKKSIVLSGTSNQNQKAVLTLEEDGVGLKGLIRFYNFSREPSGICSLGLYVNQKVYKAGLNFKSRMLYEFFISLAHIPPKFSCAVVNFENAVANAILYGSSEGSSDDVYATIINEISENNSVENVKNILDKYEMDYEAEEKKEIEKEIDKTLCSDNCANCVYKQYFYQQTVDENPQKVESVSLDDEKQLFEEPTSEKEDIFFNRLKPQIDRLFSSNPAEENLQQLIPSSKWVKVDYEDDGDFFVFGLLYDEKGNVKYVCYGVPAVFDEQPPEELSGYPIWLPLDEKNENGFGYWLTYQDADTGEPVKAIIE